MRHHEPLRRSQRPPGVLGPQFRIAVLATPTTCSSLHTTLLFTRWGATSPHPSLGSEFRLHLRLRHGFFQKVSPKPCRLSWTLFLWLLGAHPGSPWLLLSLCSHCPISLDLTLCVGVHPPTTWWYWGWNSCSVVRGGPPEVLCYKCLLNAK